MKNKDIRKDEKDGTISKLRNRIRRLEKENKKLKSELNSYDQVFKKTAKFLRDNTNELDVFELVDAAKNNKTLKQATADPVCPKCLSDDFVVVKYPAGEIHSCANCEYREQVKKEDE